MEEHLSVGISAAERIKKIIELIQQGPARGLLTVALHEGGNRESSSKFIRPYQRRTYPEQITNSCQECRSLHRKRLQQRRPPL